VRKPEIWSSVLLLLDGTKQSFKNLSSIWWKQLVLLCGGESKLGVSGKEVRRVLTILDSAKKHVAIKYARKLAGERQFHVRIDHTMLMLNDKKNEFKNDQWLYAQILEISFLALWEEIKIAAGIEEIQVKK